MAEGSDKPKYQFVDIDAKGDDAVATAFSNQVAYCTAADAPITARVVAAVAELLANGTPGALLDRIRDDESAAGIVKAFEACGATRPVEFTAAESQRAARADRPLWHDGPVAVDLPTGVWSLRNALAADQAG